MVRKIMLSDRLPKLFFLNRKYKWSKTRLIRIGNWVCPNRLTKYDQGATEIIRAEIRATDFFLEMAKENKKIETGMKDPCKAEKNLTPSGLKPKIQVAEYVPK